VWGHRAVTKEKWNELAVTKNRECFCIKISNVEWARGVMNSKEVLGNAVANPVKTHVHGFGPFRPYSTSSKT
jgi:hypothetical protein